jgi:hypothetical protein
MQVLIDIMLEQELLPRVEEKHSKKDVASFASEQTT